MVLGNAVKNKIQHNASGQYGHSKGAEDLPEEDRLNELSQSLITQIDNQDETVVDINAVNAIELEGDPKPTGPQRWVDARTQTAVYSRSCPPN
jgi:hypothetical protein